MNKQILANQTVASFVILPVTLLASAGSEKPFREGDAQ